MLGMTLLALAPLTDTAKFSPLLKWTFGLSSIIANAFYPGALLYGAWVGSTSHWTPHVNRQTEMTPPEHEALIFNGFPFIFFLCQFVVVLSDAIVFETSSLRWLLRELVCVTRFGIARNLVIQRCEQQQQCRTTKEETMMEGRG